MQTIYPSLSQPVVEASRGVCVAGHKLEAEAGATMLEQGGNAYDALVASAFMGFVVEQIDCGVGGFAHVSVWNNTNKNFYEIDGYVTAPLKSHEAIFELDDGIAYYGDPGFVPSPKNALESKEYAGWCKDQINVDKALDNCCLNTFMKPLNRE